MHYQVDANTKQLMYSCPVYKVPVFSQYFPTTMSKFRNPILETARKKIGSNLQPQWSIILALTSTTERGAI